HPYNTTSTHSHYNLSLHDSLPILQSRTSPARKTSGADSSRRSSYCSGSCRLFTIGNDANNFGEVASVVQRAQLLSPNPNLSSLVDRKSKRLNSSHVSISYAVFCLK